MTKQEEVFLQEWDIKRRKWKWGKVFLNGVIYIALPLVIIIDFVNFFIVGDVAFGFFSLFHLWELIQTFLIFSLIIGTVYGAYAWYSNELKFQSLKRQESKEKKEALKNL